MPSLSHRVIRFVARYFTKKVYPPQNYLCDFYQIRQRIRRADVLLVSGRSRASNIIKYVTNSPWSHAALYVGRISEITDPTTVQLMRQYYKGSDDEQLIIESELGSGTVLIPITKYQQEHIRIARPTALTEEDALKVMAHALQSLGREYSLRHIFDLFRFLFPYRILPRRWGSSLFTTNALQPTEDICSSMIGEAFRSVNFPILPMITYTQNYGYELTRRNSKLYTPSDFDFSPYFDIIKYPMFGPTNKVPYRNLRWVNDVPSDD